MVARMKRVALLSVLAIATAVTAARADIPTPPRPEPCRVLVEGAACWVDGRRPGACVNQSDAGYLVCQLGAPVRAPPSASASASASAAPAETSRSGCAIAVGGASDAPSFVAIGAVFGAWIRRRARYGVPPPRKRT